VPIFGQPARLKAVEFNLFQPSWNRSAEGVTLCPKDFRRKSVLGYVLYKYVTAVYTCEMTIVAHCRKVKTAVGLRNVAVHNSREAVYDKDGRLLDDKPDWIKDTKKARFNDYDGIGDNILKRRNDRIKSAKLARKPQKNASSGIEFNISASPEWFEKNRKIEDQLKFFNDALLFLGDKYGMKNVLGYGIHFDEKTPHMHVLMVPIIENENGNKYSSSEFLGGKGGLKRLQTEIYEAIGKDRGLERGVEGSSARHTDQKQWLAAQHRELERARKDLEKQIEDGKKDLEEQKKDLEAKEKDLEKREKVFNSAVNTKIRGWEMPEPKLLEGAGAYRDRVEIEVKGKLSRALKTIDDYDGKVKGIQRDADEQVMEQKRYLETYKIGQQIAVNDGRKATEKYNNLKKSILEATTVEEINQIKTDLVKPSRERDDFTR
jgi:hypothetical protein